MRSGNSEWQGCVTPIPKDARAGFEKARGEFCAYPTGWCEKSRRLRAGPIRQRKAERLGRYQPGCSASDTGPERLTKLEGFRRAAVQGESGRVRRDSRSLLFILLRSPVASATRCQRGLGIDPFFAIAGQRRAGDGSGVARENGTRTPPGSGSSPSPGAQASRPRHEASRRAGAQQGG